MNEISPPGAVPPPVTVAPVPAAVAVSGLSTEERLWAMGGHLSAFAVFLVPGFGQVLGPLIVWQVKKDTMPFAAQEAKEALNFNLTWTIATLLATAIAIPLCLLLVGFLLLPVIAIIPMVGWIFTIIGGLRANEGQAYRYPLTCRFVK